MKDFRKNDNGLFICEECGNTFTCKENVSKHVKNHHHIKLEDYYNKWFKEEGDGYCKECGKPIPIKQKYCSILCRQKGTIKIRSDKAKIKNEIKKNRLEENFKIICLECGKKFETTLKLNKHIIKVHDKKEYYDKWIKKESEGICKICGAPTRFYNRLDLGYMDCCSKECREKYKLQKRTKTNLKKHGVKNVFELEEIKQKIKDSCIKKYGVDNNMKSKKGIREYKRAMNKKYGVEWPLQDKDILDKNQKAAKKLKKFRDTDIWYQGSYELDFLEKYYDSFADIQRGPSIHYIYNGQNKVYHSDFYIPSKNLIVEIKSSWILNIDNEINEKKKAVISNGFEYLMILDKDYSNLL